MTPDGATNNTARAMLQQQQRISMEEEKERPPEVAARSGTATTSATSSASPEAKRQPESVVGVDTTALPALPPGGRGGDARIEAALAARGYKTSGSSDAHFWPWPSALWRDDAYARTWYAHAKRYWDDAVVAPATLDGVLGGFARLDAPDAAFSRRFLRELGPQWLGSRDGFDAADVAAGIGRVAARVLLPLGAARVDVVEQSASLLRAAPDFIDGVDREQRRATTTTTTTTSSDDGGGAFRDDDDLNDGRDDRGEVGGSSDFADDRGSDAVRRASSSSSSSSRRCRFFCVAMQRWRPRRRALDLVWIQWSVGHFTDTDFLAFLATCRSALKPRGLLVVKDNVLGSADSPTDDAFYVDDDDRSVCRSLAYYRVIFELAHATVLAERQQPITPAATSTTTTTTATVGPTESSPEALSGPPAETGIGENDDVDLAFPSDIYPVFAWALAWPQDWDEPMSEEEGHGGQRAAAAAPAPGEMDVDDFDGANSSEEGGGPRSDDAPPPPPPPDANLRGLGDSSVLHY